MIKDRKWKVNRKEDTFHDVMRILAKFKMHPLFKHKEHKYVTGYIKRFGWKKDRTQKQARKRARNPKPNPETGAVG